MSFIEIEARKTEFATETGSVGRGVDKGGIREKHSLGLWIE